jgi:hypothetical protein
MKACDLEVDEGAKPYVVGGTEALLSFMQGRAGDLTLVQKTAEQQAQLAVAAERIDGLEAQRRWLWGGLGVSAAVFAILLLRRRRPETPKPRGQLPERQAA